MGEAKNDTLCSSCARGEGKGVKTHPVRLLCLQVQSGPDIHA